MVKYGTFSLLMLGCFASAKFMLSGNEIFDGTDNLDGI